MAGWGLAADLGLGLLYAPICVLVLQVIYIFYRLLRGGPTDGSVGEITATTDLGTLFGVLAMSIVLGGLYGPLIGLLGGLTAGVLMMVLYRFTVPRLLDDYQPRNPLSVVSALGYGLVALLLLMLLNLPTGLAYLGTAWVMIGWLVYIFVPTFIAAGAGWWISNRVLHRAETRVHQR